MKPVRLMFARFPGGGVDRAEVTDWLVESVVWAKDDDRIEDPILNYKINDTPITMGRNRTIEIAKAKKVDFLVMIDNDMAPDLYTKNGPSEFINENARPFVSSAFDFLYKRRVNGDPPAVIGAPYCGPPPHENIYVFQWRVIESECPSDSTRISLEQYSREQASTMSGIKEAAALPTGLVMIDMKAIESVKPPYFYYEWMDETQSEKASTEDVTFTRDLSLNGVPQFCNWDSWAGHWKLKCVGMPLPISPDSISEVFRRRVLSRYNIDSGDDLIFMRNGKVAKQHGPETVFLKKEKLSEKAMDERKHERRDNRSSVTDPFTTGAAAD